MRQYATTSLDRRHRSADALHLRLRLEAAADDAEPPRAGASEVFRCDAARSTRAQLTEAIRLDHADGVARYRVEEHDHERPGVRLAPRDAEAAVDGAHERERAAVAREPKPRLVDDFAGRKTTERFLDDRHRVRGFEQRLDVGLGEVERHGGSLDLAA